MQDIKLLENGLRFDIHVHKSSICLVCQNIMVLIDGPLSQTVPKIRLYQLLSELEIIRIALQCFRIAADYAFFESFLN